MSVKSCCIYSTGVISILTLIAGIVLVLSQVFQNILNAKIKKEIVLRNGTHAFDVWENPPPPVYMQFYFFNVTNPAEVLKGERPAVLEVGPYTYREYRAKENVTFVDNGTRVSAYQPKTFVFLPERSVGDPDDDMITTINIPAVAVMNKVKDSFWKSSMVSIWMNSLNVGMFMTRSVNELLWGFKDPLLSRIHPMNPEIDEYFGLMYKKNGSNDGEFVYHTGEADFMDYGRVATFKGESKLSLWTSEQSNMINGTDGSAFHPLLSKTERLYIFSPDLCRSIFMEFEKDVKVKGLPAYRFTPPRDVLASKEENPANEGFCVSPKECLGTGLLKVSVCRKGAPVVTSFPHFYLGDEKYSNAIEGLDPVREHHQTYLDLNPTTGVPIRASKRAQINILINRISGFPKTKSLNETIFPVMFINETVVIDDVSAAKLHKLLLMVSLVSNFPLVLVGLGAILLLVFIGLIVCECKQKKSTKEDTSYSPVSNKEADEKNGSSYVALTPVIDKS
uniref:Scavenger receptor class B, member 2c n=1 Tax=Salmo trutta TaxID=8032 RepID=A0A673Y9B6_SALTR